ncbi:hypothetical protein LZ30DRAFT_787398 [Colletotrichum cereale]|nr:hypothetical protein LZ30DRAFT_787398 [Colletotrichum cereale]
MGRPVSPRTAHLYAVLVTVAQALLNPLNPVVRHCLHGLPSAAAPGLGLAYAREQFGFAFLTGVDVDWDALESGPAAFAVGLPRFRTTISAVGRSMFTRGNRQMLGGWRQPATSRASISYACGAGLRFSLLSRIGG